MAPTPHLKEHPLSLLSQLYAFLMQAFPIAEGAWELLKARGSVMYGPGFAPSAYARARLATQPPVGGALELLDSGLLSPCVSLDAHEWLASFPFPDPNLRSSLQNPEIMSFVIQTPNAIFPKVVIAVVGPYHSLLPQM